MFNQRKRKILQESLRAFFFFLVSLFALYAIWVLIEIRVLIPYFLWTNGCSIFFMFLLFGISLATSISSLRTIKKENQEYCRQMQLLGSVLAARATMFLQHSQQREIDENQWDD